MAFYPTWQTTAAATSDQAWQNQFIQQIPQNGNAPVTATAIAPLNSIDFQQVNQVKLEKCFPGNQLKPSFTGLRVPYKWLRPNCWNSVRSQLQPSFNHIQLAHDPAIRVSDPTDYSHQPSFSAERELCAECDLQPNCESHSFVKPSAAPSPLCGASAAWRSIGQ